MGEAEDEMAVTPKKNNSDTTKYTNTNNRFNDLGSNDDSTKVKTNLFQTKDMIHRTNKIYYSVRLQVGDSQNALKGLQTSLRKWFKAMKECLSSIVVYKYFEPDFKITINKESEITANIQKMK